MSSHQMKILYKNFQDFFMDPDCLSKNVSNLKKYFPISCKHEICTFCDIQTVFVHKINTRLKNYLNTLYEV